VTPMQIEGMVDRICGLFPTTQIGRNTVKNAWSVEGLRGLPEACGGVLVGLDGVVLSPAVA